VKFTILKADLEHIVNCLDHGASITAPPGGWSETNILMVAAAIFQRVIESCSVRKIVETEPREVMEAKLDRLKRELTATLIFIGYMYCTVRLGHYDAEFENEVQFSVNVSGNKEVIVESVSGCKRGEQRGVYKY